MNAGVPAASLPRADGVVLIAGRHLIVAHVLVEVISIGIAVLVLRVRRELVLIVKLMMLLRGWILLVS